MEHIRRRKLSAEAYKIAVNVLGSTLFVFIVGLFLAPAVILTEGYSNAAPEKENPDVVVATVNDKQILKSQVDMAVAAYKKKTGKASVAKDEKTELVKSMIRRQLILSSPEVQSYRSDPLIVQKVQEYENHLIISKYLSRSVGPSIVIGEQQMRDYYDQNRREFALKPRVEARHILLKSNEDAQTVLAELKTGQDFSELAKKYSIDLPMALEGGSMGVIEKGRTLPVLEKTLFSLAEGETSDVVKTPYGYHIIVVDKIHPADIKPYKDVRTKIKKTLIRNNEARAFNQMATELEKQAAITIYQERL